MSAACCPAPSCAQRPRWEVADVLRLYGEAYRRDHALPASHLEVMHAIETCRTAHLGGHVERCDACGFERPAYDSCRNRHCPKCQALVKARWLAARERELLPVEYFHTVFTIPHVLNPVALSNKKALYGLLFRAAAESLQEFGRSPRHGLGGKLGFTAILHTWDQKLLDYTHLHCLIPGGALSTDGQRWTPARQGFLFPVNALSLPPSIRTAHPVRARADPIYPAHREHSSLPPPARLARSRALLLLPFPIALSPTPASGIVQCDLIGNADALPIRPSLLPMGFCWQQERRTQATGLAAPLAAGWTMRRMEIEP